ncbi:MAG: recombinase family protein [Anaerocolumna sp.]
MARKSRQNAIAASLSGVATESVALPERMYNTAIYVRLSVEDNNYGAESESIQNQQLMLERFVSEQSDMRLCQIFCDNGFSGTDFERPDFEKMMDEAMAGRIDCIVVKDLSRFGRNYVEAGYYIEKTFPTMGVRFIAMHDGYDSLTDDGSNSMIISLKNLINDFCAKDISRKINTSLETKQRKGEFIGAFAPYGYKKSPEDKNQLILDEDTAPTVYQIFQWKAQGIGNTTIARKLNEANIVSPSLYLYQKGEIKKKPQNELWQGQMIKVITDNPIYTGCMAQGKTKKALCDGLPTTKVPRCEWIVVPHTHEAIIDEETFEIIQQQKEQIRQQAVSLRGKYDKHGKKENIFAGLLYCGDCHTKLVRYKDATATSVRYYQQCRVYNENLSHGCIKKFTREEVLEAAIFSVIRSQIDLAVDMKKLLVRFNESSAYQKHIHNLQRNIQTLQQKIKRITTLKNTLFESFDNGTISEEDFLYMKERYNGENAGLKEELQQVTQELTKYTEELTAKNKWITSFERYAKEQILTREMMLELVSRVWVWADNRFEIVLNFKDEFQLIIINVKGAEDVCQKHSLSI